MPSMPAVTVHTGWQRSTSHTDVDARVALPSVEQLSRACTRTRAVGERQWRRDRPWPRPLTVCGVAAAAWSAGGGDANDGRRDRIWRAFGPSGSREPRRGIDGRRERHRAEAGASSAKFRCAAPAQCYCARGETAAVTPAKSRQRRAPDPAMAAPPRQLRSWRSRRAQPRPLYPLSGRHSRQVRN